MALSLADELAGFDDGPNAIQGGLSLANEFGIDGAEQNGLSLGDELDAELGDAMWSSSPTSPPSSYYTQLKTAMHDQPMPTRNGTRRRTGHLALKPSSSSMTAISHDLDGGSDLNDQSFITDAETSYHTALSNPQSPTRPDVRDKDVDPVGGGPVEWSTRGRDPLDDLQDMHDANARFLDLLKSVDAPLSAEQSQRNGRSELSGATLDRVDVAMQRLLERLRSDHTLRDEQCRRLGHLVRAYEVFGWDGLSRLDVDLDILGRLTESFEEDEGSATSQVLPISPGTPLLPAMTIMSTPVNVVAHHVVDATAALIASLQVLSEGLHNTASFSNGTSRQRRGLKASIESMCEMRDREEEARRFVDLYERDQLQRGLKGDRVDLRGELTSLCGGFEEMLEESGARMEEIRRRLAGRAVAVK